MISGTDRSIGKLRPVMFLKASHANFITVMLFCVLAANGQTQPSENTDALGSAATGGAYRVGGGVTPPRVTYQPDPEYSDEARAAGFDGTCVLKFVVGRDGIPRDIQVSRTLGLGLDEKAIEAVSQWRFKPGMKDGKPVAVLVSAEITFRGDRGETNIARLQKSANAGDPKAALELAKDYFEGRDHLPKSEARGLELLQRAAYSGTAEAQFQMGEHAYARAIVSADYENAYVWYELALRGGYIQSEKMLKEITPKLSPEQLSDARTRADKWPDSFKGSSPEYATEGIASYCATHPASSYGGPGTASGVSCSDWVRQNQSKH
jgi:TonB family protein